MKFLFGSWNLNAFTGGAKRVKFLNRLQPDLIALQEVNEDLFDTVSGSGLFDWGVWSINKRRPEPAEGKERTLGCAVLGREPFEVRDFELIWTAPFPERTVCADVSGPDGKFLCCSFHAPPGVTHKEKKPQSFVAIADWLADRSQPIVFGFDANTPKWDRPDLNKSAWHWEDEPVLVGPEPRHDLKDAFRVYLNQNPAIANAIRTLRPDGPLEVSYVRGRGQTKYLCRYDFIYVSDEFRVETVAYHYNEAVRAGSDHAVVMASLDLQKA